MSQRRFGARNGLDSAVCVGPIIDVYAPRRYMRYAPAVQGRVPLGRDVLLRAAGSLPLQGKRGLAVRALHHTRLEAVVTSCLHLAMWMYWQG